MRAKTLKAKQEEVTAAAAELADEQTKKNESALLADANRLMRSRTQ